MSARILSFAEKPKKGDAYDNVDAQSFIRGEAEASNSITETTVPCPLPICAGMRSPTVRQLRMSRYPESPD